VATDALTGSATRRYDGRSRRSTNTSRSRSRTASLDAHGRPCIEAKAPQDVDASLAMPGGHLFYGELSWPWAPNRALLESPAQKWGVATDLPNLFLCGGGARRAGAVSGVGGHNAARAVLESRAL